MEPNINMLKVLSDNIDTLEKFIGFLLILLLVNIFMTLLKFYLDYRHSKQHFLLERKKLIFENAIKIEHEIFMKIDDLADFDKTERDALTSKIVEARECLNANRLYIETKLYDAFDKALDYYTLISSNFRKKDPKKETKLTEKIIKAFHG